MIFENRHQAGEKLAEKLIHLRGKKNAIILGLARGGVEVAASLGSILKLPVDVVVVRKVGAPGNEELALGAVASFGEPVLNEHLISILGISRDYIKKAVERERLLVNERTSRYLKGRSPLEVEGKEVILVDDGIATGASMKVAIQALKPLHPSKMIVAVPVAAPDSLAQIRGLVDEVVCLFSPSSFQAVGTFYNQFGQVSDEEVTRLLQSGG